MKKVLFITVRADMGGGPKHVFDLCSNLQNIDVYIAAPNEEPFFSKYQNIAKGIIEIPHRKFSLLKFFEILIFCRANGINTVHSHGRGAGIYSRLLGLFGLRVIHTFHGVHRENGIKGYIKLKIDFFLKYITSQFICVSESEKKLSRNCNVSIDALTVVINNGVDINEIQKFKTVPEQRNTIILGTLARLTYQKGLDILIDYFSNLEDDYELWIAGEGEDRKKLEEQISVSKLNERVKLVGQTSAPYDFLNKLDIYVSAARWEGLPLSVLEAMAMSLNVLISDVDGHSDLKKYIGDNCFFTDKDSFLRKIQVQKENQNNKIVLDHFTLEKMREETVDLLTKSY